jgi:hypothetical protein
MSPAKAAAGHTIGTSQKSPLRLEKMPFIKAEQEINEGSRPGRTTGAVPPHSRTGARKSISTWHPRS